MDARSDPCLLYTSFFAGTVLDADRLDRIYDFLETNKVDVLQINEDEDLELDPDLFIEEELEEEEEIDMEHIDLSVPEGISVEDPVRMYLKEIGKVPLLSSDDEIELDVYKRQCLNCGCLPTKTYLHTTGLFREVKKTEAAGLHTEGMHVSMAELKKRKDAVVEELRAGIEKQLAAAKIDLYLSLIHILSEKRLSRRRENRRGPGSV